VVCLTLEVEGIMTLQYVGSHSPVDSTAKDTCAIIINSGLLDTRR